MVFASRQETTRGLPAIATCQRQSGAAAIEFALVFVLLFFVFYALLSVTFPMLLMQTFEEAAAEGTRQAVAINRDDFADLDDYRQAVSDRAVQVTSTRIEWIPNRDHITVDATWEDNVVDVTINLDYAAHPIIPPLGAVPGFDGPFPPIPDTVGATSTVEF